MDRSACFRSRGFAPIDWSGPGSTPRISQSRAWSWDKKEEIMRVIDELHAVLFEGTQLRHYIGLRRRVIKTLAARDPDFVPMTTGDWYATTEKRILHAAVKYKPRRGPAFDGLDSIRKLEIIKTRCPRIAARIRENEWRRKQLHSRVPSIERELFRLLDSRPVGRRPGFQSKATLLLELAALVLGLTRKRIRDICRGDVAQALIWRWPMTFGQDPTLISQQASDPRTPILR